MKYQRQKGKEKEKEGGAGSGAGSGTGTGTGTGLGISILPESASPFSSVHGYVSELNNSAIFGAKDF